MAKKERRNLVLKKHVGAIQCSNKISLVQRKISNALLYNAYDKLDVDEVHTIQIPELCKLIGFKSNDQKLIKDGLKKLLSTVLEWNVVEEGEGAPKESWSASSILASVSIDSSICRYSYSVELKKLLYMPSMYGKLDLAVQAQFSSTYALALYENCVRYQGVGQTKWFDVELFRKLMGVEPTKYKLFRDFRKRIIDKAVEEVNEFSNLEVVPELRREKRAVVAVRFLIKIKNANAQQSNLSLPAISDMNEEQSFGDKESSELYECLRREFDLSNKQATESLANYSVEYIREKIRLVKSSAPYLNGKIKSVSSYILSALRDDYKASASSGEKVRAVRKESLKREFIQKDHQKQQEELLSNYKQYISKNQFEAFKKLRKAIRDKILVSFEEFLVSMPIDMLKKKYRQSGFRSKLVKAEFLKFLQDNYNARLPEPISFGEFKEGMCEEEAV